MASEISITITPKAAEKLKETLTDEKKDYLRAFVQGGGCSGFQYGLMTEKEPGQGDTVTESNGIKIVIDPISVKYLGGSVIDYTDNLVGGGFTFQNPNAKGTCGCGSSFEPK